jgi:hypothetical protein
MPVALRLAVSKGATKGRPGTSLTRRLRHKRLMAVFCSIKGKMTESMYVRTILFY